MRIAIVIDSLMRGGAERQALNAVLELTRAGRDAELIYYRDTTPKYAHAAYEQARVTRLPKNGQPVRFIWRLGRYLKHRRFDIVHAFKNTPTAYAYVAARLAGIHVVLGGFRVEYDARGIYHWTDVLVNRVAAGWVVNSQATARSLQAALGVRPQRLFVVYNGINARDFASPLTPAEAKRKVGLPSTVPVISIIGRLEPQKNHALFLDVAARLRAVAPEAKFLVAGDGSLRESLEQRARALDLTETVHFLGVRTDMPDILAATDLMVLTSHYEGVANALLEAMCVGLPVVSTDYAGVEELLVDGREGFIVPRGDAAAMAERVLQLLQNPPLARRMGQEGRKTVAARFSMEAMGAGLYSVYEKCLGDGRGSSACLGAA